MTDEQRNHYDNLIFLCADHHTQIDTQEADFPLADLVEMKRLHERKVQAAMLDALSGVGFPELEQAARVIPGFGSPTPDPEFTLTPPQQKLDRNRLSDNSRITITMGMAAVQQAKQYVESEARLDPEFPGRLKAGFLSEYYRLRSEDADGDLLFDLMCRFAQRGLQGQASRSAGLALLVYLFEACEVFEP